MSHAFVSPQTSSCDLTLSCHVTHRRRTVTLLACSKIWAQKRSIHSIENLCHVLSAIARGAKNTMGSKRPARPARHHQLRWAETKTAISLVMHAAFEAFKRALFHHHCLSWTNCCKPTPAPMPVNGQCGSFPQLLDLALLHCSHRPFSSSRCTTCCCTHTTSPPPRAAAIPAAMLFTSPLRPHPRAAASPVGAPMQPAQALRRPFKLRNQLR